MFTRTHTHTHTHTRARAPSLTPDGKKDPTSLHGSCPTHKGEKWSATKWIHVAPFGGKTQQGAPHDAQGASGCRDSNPQCSEVGRAV
jgi:prolyl 4-hydroxylase